MAVYSVHLPTPARPAKSPTPPGRAFLREGFSWPAFFFGPFWLLARGFWLWAALWCAAVLVLLSLAVGGLALRRRGIRPFAYPADFPRP